MPEGVISTPVDQVDALCAPYAQAIHGGTDETPTIDRQILRDAEVTLALDKIAQAAGVPYHILVGD